MPIGDDSTLGTATAPPLNHTITGRADVGPSTQIGPNPGLPGERIWRWASRIYPYVSANTAFTVNFPHGIVEDFPIRSVIVDNRTNQWLRIESAGNIQFVPPWFKDLIFRGSGAPQLNLDLTAPPNITQAALSGSEFIQIRVTEDLIPPNAGLPFQS